MPQWAEVEAVRAKAAEWTDRQILCRTSGHAWTPFQVTHQPGWFHVTERCTRCRNRRSHDMDERGYATPWRMIYVEGYLLNGFGRVDADGKAVLRLAKIRNQPVVEIPPDE